MPRISAGRVQSVATRLIVELSLRGRRIMHAAGLDVLDAPVVLGDPPAVVRVP